VVEGRVGDIAEFLRGHPPFDAAQDAELLAVAAAAVPEHHRPGATIFPRAAPVAHLRVIRTGTVQLELEGRVLDELGPGELFGHASMLSGLPPGFAAVAVAETLCYRIPAEVVRPLLGAPAGLQFLGRSLLDVVAPRSAYADPAVNPAQRPVGELLRGALVLCRPGLPIREAAQRMTDAGATCTVIDLGGGRLGILTDRDLRQRVVAAGLDTAAPVSAAMTAPAVTVPADRLGGEVLLDMLDRGIRHLPVLSPRGDVLGVLEDVDLVAVTTRSSFHLRQAIARADSVDGLAAAAAALRPTVVDLHRAKVAATDIAGIYSVVGDALTRRMIELVIRDRGAPARPFTWLALGSFARREAVPSSDVDSALVWPDGGDGELADPAAAREARAIAERVLAGLAACGFPADRKGAVASNPLFARSHAGWAAAIGSWLDDPTQDKALILVSLIVDGRPVWGVRHDPALQDVFRSAREHPDLLRLLALFALAHRPPTGFLRDFVVEHSGERRGRLDLKAGGLVPIADLARWAGMAAGVASGSTPARLQAAAQAGTLDGGDARTLEEAFEFLLWLRLDHQVDQIRAGVAPDDHVRPAGLSRVVRGSLKEVFRAVASVQRRIAVDLQLGIR
jgi:CBS domain-containing protein